MRLVFLHVPKTGGTSLHEVLARNFKPEELCPERLRFLDKVSEPDLHRYRFFSGHYFFDQLARIPEPKTIITLLREPRARLLSHYYYFKSHTWEFIARIEKLGIDSPRRAKELDLYSYLQDPDPTERNYYDNAITRHLIGRDYLNSEGNFVVEDAEALEIALDRLRTAVRWAVLERYSNSKANLEHALGFVLPELLPRERTFESLESNSDFEPVVKPPLDQRTEALLRHCTRLDERVYSWALSHIDKSDRRRSRVVRWLRKLRGWAPPSGR